MYEIVAPLLSAVFGLLLKKAMEDKNLSDDQYHVLCFTLFIVWFCIVYSGLELYHAARIAEGLARWPDMAYELWTADERALAPFVNTIITFPIIATFISCKYRVPRGTELEKAQWQIKEALFFLKVTMFNAALLCLYVYLTR